MSDLKSSIPVLRQSVAAILKVRVDKKLKYHVNWGSAFCVVSDKYLVSAFHVLNDGKPRDPSTKFYALVVPDNGDAFFTFPVVGFPLERKDLDIAVLELSPCSNPQIHISALQVSYAPQADGTEVLTMGFPAPEVGGLDVDHAGNVNRGEFFLKSHANAGIVSARYMLQVSGGQLFYELNVGWHHGESSGPIAAVMADRPVAFSLMQHYREVQGPHGVLDGPRRGIGLSCIRQELQALGAIESR